MTCDYSRGGLLNNRIICIDFGNSYTKIGVRTSYSGTTFLARNLRNAQADSELGQNFCFPSVIAQRKTPDGQVRHAFGEAAAGIIPGRGTHVYRNWKPKLLSEPDALTPQRDTWRQLSVLFFESVRHELAEALPSTQDMKVRICIPRVEPAMASERENLIRDVLTAAGWSVVDSLPVIYEPEANTWGIVTEGYNHTWIPNRGPRRRSVNLHEMLRNRRLFRALREAARLKRLGDFQYRVLVVDIGAYTTDCGLVTLDGSVAEQECPRPAVIHHSYEMGIKELDLDIFQRSSQDAQAGIASMSTRDWELLKPRLYSGDDIITTIDDDARSSVRISAEPVAECLERFSEQVLRCCDEFREMYLGGQQLNEVVLTGGGMRIAHISEAMIGAVRSRRIDARHILPAEANHELSRGASALGGASVICG